MPYVEQKRREQLDPVIDALTTKLAQMAGTSGDLTYCVYRLIHETCGLWMWERAKTPYIALCQAIGVLECAKLELYRRVGGPKEDKAIEKNGDIT